MSKNTTNCHTGCKGEFKCYMIWQMVMAILHSNQHQRIGKDGDTENELQKPDLQQNTTEEKVAKHT